MSKPIGELIVNVPTPGSDKRENETPALLESNLIEARIVHAHLDRRVGNIEFEWPHATGFEVDEDDSSRGADEVARVRFSVQQLLGGRTALDGFACTVKGAHEKVSVTVIQRGGLASVRDKTLRRRGALHHVRCLDLDVSHGCVQPLEGNGVFSWFGRIRGRLVVGPEGDGEAIDFVYARFDPRVERCDRAGGRG